LTRRKIASSNLLEFYLRANARVVDLGYSDEILWYRRQGIAYISEEKFLRESAWVVLSSGFREQIVRRIFGFISLCFFDWHSAHEIHTNAQDCMNLAACKFRHEGKLQAIVSIARLVVDSGFEALRESITRDPIGTIRKFPYMGPATAFHLAKNLGVPVSKPDRHLERLALRLGYADARSLCSTVSRLVGEPEHIVDSVLWRFCVVGGLKAYSL